MIIGNHLGKIEKDKITTTERCSQNESQTEIKKKLGVKKSNIKGDLLW